MKYKIRLFGSVQIQFLTLQERPENGREGENSLGKSVEIYSWDEGRVSIFLLLCPRDPKFNRSGFATY